ncbi:MAG: DUF423 domain-containing protein [Methylococcaceae bacterium]|nr:DUF423 domain-containing protein [Methylococcaceae bacterium]
MKSVFLSLGAFCAFSGVGLGAFGAHGLKTILSAESLAIYQTGVTYQMWHSLGLFGVGLLQNQMPESKKISWSGRFMFLGILLFSGSLYLLAILDYRWLGMITPVGGVCFLLSWLLLFLTFQTKNSNSRYK